METSISLLRASVTYRVHMDKTTSIKEWFTRRLGGRKWNEGKYVEVRALKDIDLEVRHGERFGIIGLNGAGKSTMLKLVSGLIKPTSGSIEVWGSVQPLIEINAGFNPEFTGRENIYFNGAMLGFSKKEIKSFEARVIEFSGLEEMIDMPVKCYSTGMGARLAFSIATTIKPEILVLDEMLSAGDISFVDKAKDRMASLIDNAKMLVIVSHNLALIESLCSRTIVLEKGSIAFDGAPKEAVAFYRASVAKG